MLEQVFNESLERRLKPAAKILPLPDDYKYSEDIDPRASSLPPAMAYTAIKVRRMLTGAAVILNGQQVGRAQILRLIALMDQKFELLNDWDNGRTGFQRYPRWVLAVSGQLDSYPFFESIDVDLWSVCVDFSARKITKSKVKHGFIYAYTQNCSPGLVKFGGTCNLDRRMQAVNWHCKRANQPDYPTIRRVWEVADYFFCESYVRQKLKKLNARYTGTCGKEWYRAEVGGILRHVEQLQADFPKFVLRNVPYHQFPSRNRG